MQAFKLGHEVVFVYAPSSHETGSILRPLRVYRNILFLDFD